MNSFISLSTTLLCDCRVAASCSRSRRLGDRCRSDVLCWYSRVRPFRVSHSSKTACEVKANAELSASGRSVAAIIGTARASDSLHARALFFLPSRKTCVSLITTLTPPASGLCRLSSNLAIHPIDTCYVLLMRSVCGLTIHPAGVRPTGRSSPCGKRAKRVCRPVQCQGWPHHQYVAIFVCSFSSSAATPFYPEHHAMARRSATCNASLVPERSGSNKLARMYHVRLYSDKAPSCLAPERSGGAKQLTNLTFGGGLVFFRLPPSLAEPADTSSRYGVLLLMLIL